MSDKLTTRQRQVLGVIVQQRKDLGYAPTLREIGVRMGISSTNAVNDHLKALERKGYIKRGENVARSIVVLKKPTDTVR